MSGFARALLVAVAVAFLIQCRSHAAPDPQPLRVAMLNPEGVVMADYSFAPTLRIFGIAINRDVDYWGVADEYRPTTFVASPSSVRADACIGINDAILAHNLPTNKVCGLRELGVREGCVLFAFSDPTYGRGIIAVAPVALDWHLEVHTQQQVGDCVAQAILATVGGDNISDRARYILMGYRR